MQSFIRQSLKIWMICLFSLSYDCFGAMKPWYFTAADVNALHSAPAEYRIPYGNDSLQFGDLRLPNCPGPHPVAIVIHGGCWMSKFASVQNTSALSDALRCTGIATWNIEYRGVDNTGGGWPGTFDDVGHAADFLRTIASKYSLDLNRVIVIGHSAGGHLALWLAARHRLSQESPLYSAQPIDLHGALVLGAAPDLRAFREQGRSDTVCSEDVIGKLLGGSSESVTKNYKDASPKELLPLGIPQILIYGADDQAVPAEYGLVYMRAAQKKGDSVELFVVKNAAHHEYNVPNSIAWPVVKASVLSLINGSIIKNTEKFQCLVDQLE